MYQSKIYSGGQDELIGKNIWELFPKAVGSLTYAKFQEAVRTQEVQRWVTDPQTSGRYYSFAAYPHACGLTVFFTDITAEKLREMELAKLERLNLIGQLAAGIGHEVRNPLTTVRGFLQLFLRNSDTERNQRNLELMIEELDRANDIITDFLSLAKANSENLEKHNLRESIDSLYPIMQADAFSINKDLILDLQPIPDIMANAAEIKQLILNLVRNGLEASQVGQKVTIATYRENEKIVLAIKDQGSGLPEHIQQQLGTPFLTTKDTGTGLGLAISIGIAHRHQAEFDYHTGKDGTTFFIRFRPEEAN